MRLRCRDESHDLTINATHAAEFMTRGTMAFAAEADRNAQQSHCVTFPSSSTFTISQFLILSVTDFSDLATKRGFLFQFFNLLGVTVQTGQPCRITVWQCQNNNIIRNLMLKVLDSNFLNDVKIIHISFNSAQFSYHCQQHHLQHVPSDGGSARKVGSAEYCSAEPCPLLIVTLALVRRRRSSLNAE